jgi:adenylyltransferase/sulfurtransferase
VPSCAEGGVLGILPGLVGIIQATEVIKLILGIGESLAGRLLLVDALTMKFRTLKLRKNPDCPICGTHPTVTALIDYDQFCGIQKPTSVGPLEVAQNKAVADAPLVDGIPQISVQELKRRIDAHEDVFVLDVREPHEAQIVNIGAPLIPLGELPKRLDELAAQKDQDIVIHCKSGGRSQKAAQLLKNAGFPHVENLAGGILAWADKIDPTLPKY